MNTCIPITSTELLLTSYSPAPLSPSFLSKWMIQTSRHFTPNYFSMNYPRQVHFLPNIFHSRQLALSQHHDVTCTMFSVVAKMSFMDLFNLTENLVKIGKLWLVMCLPFLTTCKSHRNYCHCSYSSYLNFWRVQAIRLAEQPTFYINKYVHDLTKVKYFDKTTAWVMLGTSYYNIAGVT